MNRILKGFLIFIGIACVAALVLYYYMYKMPKRNVESEKSIVIAAAQLVAEYQGNEKEANKKYLDRAIKVSGVVSDTGRNQEGNPTIMLASDDPFVGVFCTIRKAEEKADIKLGEAIKIKGICSGMLTDVRIGEAVIVKSP
jgi:hypothetical protein